MGMVGITEGAIPFAAGDPGARDPLDHAGSMVASAIAMLGGVGDHAPHGGPIVLPVVDNRLMYVVAIVRGRRRDGGRDQPVKRLTETAPTSQESVTVGSSVTQAAGHVSKPAHRPARNRESPNREATDAEGS